MLALALVLLPALWAIEQRAADPVLNLRLFGNRQIAIVAGLAFGAGVTEAVTLFVPSLLVAAFGVTPAAASFMLIPMVIGMAVGSPVSGRMLDRTGSKVAVLAGTLLIIAGLVLEGLATASLAAFYGFSALFGVGIGVLLGASLRYILLNETTREERTAAQGVLTVFTSVGQLVGAALLGAVAAAQNDGVGGYAAALLMAAAVMVPLLGAALGLKGRSAELATARRNAEAGAAA
jgi:MFS family permease